MSLISAKTTMTCMTKQFLQSQITGALTLVWVSRWFIVQHYLLSKTLNIWRCFYAFGLFSWNVTLVARNLRQAAGYGWIVSFSFQQLLNLKTWVVKFPPREWPSWKAKLIIVICWIAESDQRLCDSINKWKFINLFVGPIWTC